MSLISPLMSNPFSFYQYLEKCYLDEPYNFIKPFSWDIGIYWLNTISQAYPLPLLAVSLSAIFLAWKNKISRTIVFTSIGFMLFSLIFWKWRVSRQYLVQFIPLLIVCYALAIYHIGTFFINNNQPNLNRFLLIVWIITILPILFGKTIPMSVYMIFKDQRTLTWSYLVHQYPEKTKIYYISIRPPFRDNNDIFVEKELPTPKPLDLFDFTRTPEEADIIVLSKTALDFSRHSLERKNWGQQPYTMNESFKNSVFGKYTFSPQILAFIEQKLLKEYLLVFDTDSQYSNSEKALLPFYSRLLVWEKNK